MLVAKPAFDFFDRPEKSTHEETTFIVQLLMTILRTTLSRLISGTHLTLSLHTTFTNLAMEQVFLIQRFSQRYAHGASRRQRKAEFSQSSELMAHLAIFYLARAMDPPHLIFNNIVERLVPCLEDPSTMTVEAKTVWRASRHASKYYLDILRTLKGYSDTQRVYEQRLVRQFSTYDALAREVWALGVLKQWITFEHVDATILNPECVEMEIKKQEHTEKEHTEHEHEEAL